MLRGRMDKRFCDDYCRSAYNNKLLRNTQGAGLLRKVNSILRKNRRILEEMMAGGGEPVKVQQAVLVKKGFNFNYLTGVFADQDGSIYYFCYEYGYRIIDNEWFYVIKRLKIRR
jgi:hypothetical protein